MTSPTSKTGIDIGTVGVLQFVAVPETKVTLHPPSVNIRDEVTNVPITGRHVNLPTGGPLPADLFWVVTDDAGQVTEHRIEGCLHFSGSSDFEFAERRQDTCEGTPQLKVFEHGLFGKGKVGVRLEPKYPHCPPVVLKPDGISFDNSFVVTVHTADGAREIDRLASSAAFRFGAQMDLSLTATGLAADYLRGTGSFKLAIRETDEGDEKPGTDSGVREEFIWRGDQWSGDGSGGRCTADPSSPSWEATTSGQVVATYPYWLGCERQLEQGVALLQYQEANEKGGFELAYSTAVAKQGDAFRPVVVDKAWLHVEKPRLGAFSLRFEAPNPPTCHDARIMAEGDLLGFDPHVVLKLELALFRKPAGRGPSRVGAPCFAHSKGGHFEVELHACAFPLDQDEVVKFVMGYRLPSRTRAEQPTLFAGMRFPEEVVATKGALSRSFDWDNRRMASLNEGGALCEYANARWVSSTEARTGYTSLTALRAAIAPLLSSGEFELSIRDEKSNKASAGLNVELLLPDGTTRLVLTDAQGRIPLDQSLPNTGRIDVHVIRDATEPALIRYDVRKQVNPQTSDVLRLWDKRQVVNRIVAKHSVVRRLAWGRKRPNYARMDEDWDYDTIVIHHSGDGDNKTPQKIEALHMDEKGWDDVGYHYVIDRSGVIHEGRHLAYKGAHVEGANTHKLGILIIGDFEPQFYDLDDDAGPSSAQTSAALALINTLKAEFASIVNLGGHRDYKPDTACPGKRLYVLLPAWRLATSLGGP